MNILFQITIEGKQFTFVDEYQNHLDPLKGDWVTFPAYSGFRSSCVYNNCNECPLQKTKLQSDVNVCHSTLYESPHIQSLIPDHIKQLYPEVFL